MTATQVDALVGVVPSKHQGIIAPQHVRRSMGSTALFSSPYDEMGEYEERQSLGRRRVRPRKPTSVDAQKLEKEREEAKVRREEALKDPTLLTKHTFGERKDLHPSTRRALTETMGLREMTQVQAKTYVPILEGYSVVAKARTGTGKTLAFLLPALERLLAGDKDLYIPGQGIGMVIVAPTRELVIQIADEANRVLTYHAKDYSVCSIYGGTKFARDMGLFQKRLPTILVATPGRLRDHIADTRVKGKRFSDILASTGIVVLDEMDSLLDLGFKREITKILSYLPRPEKRQTLLFSATVPRSMKEVMKSIINPSYQFVNCVSDQDAAAQTNERVQQSFIRLANVGDYLPALATIVRQSMDRDENFKILVFFPTAKLVTFCTEFLQTFLDGSVYKLHSRMSQSARQRTSTTFRESSKAILCTSDVSARGKWIGYHRTSHYQELLGVLCVQTTARPNMKGLVMRAFVYLPIETTIDRLVLVGTMVLTSIFTVRRCRLSRCNHSCTGKGRTHVAIFTLNVGLFIYCFLFVLSL